MRTDRPWVLEVWETDPDTLEDEWRSWSTTAGPEGALRILGRLANKGHQARVRNSTTGEILGATDMCPHCNESHLPPFDGCCIL